MQTTDHAKRTANFSSDEARSLTQEDAPNTPFPAIKLFYVLLTATIVLLLGSVLAYVL